MDIVDELIALVAPSKIDVGDVAVVVMLILLLVDLSMVIMVCAAVAVLVVGLDVILVEV